MESAGAVRGMRHRAALSRTLAYVTALQRARTPGSCLPDVRQRSFRLITVLPRIDTTAHIGRPPSPMHACRE
jgi:hypothetical protein